MESKTKKSSLWGLVIWNVSLLLVLSVVFVKLLLKKVNDSWNFSSIEELIFLVGMGILMIVLLKPTFGNIRKLKASYSGVDAEDSKAITYAFQNMYEELSNRRIILLFLSPLISFIILVIVSFIMIRSSGFIANDTMSIMIEVFANTTIWLTFMVVAIICLLLALKTRTAKNNNIAMLQKVYASASEEEIQKLDSIKEGYRGFVYTDQYLVNWSGFLNIVPLSEIETIRYVKYFYLVLYGTKLVIKRKNGKKHTITDYGPNGAEWIKRGYSVSNPKNYFMKKR